MKKISFLLSFVYLCLALTSNGQIIDPKRTAKRKAEQRTNTRIDQGIDRVFDKAEEGVGNMFKKKKKKSENNSDNSQNNNNNNQQSNSNSDNSSQNAGNSSDFQVNTKFDFVSGEKVIAVEDFTQDAIGDFPAKWNTNGTGAVVTLGNSSTRWLKIGAETVLYPEFINNLPENFTFEFDLACNNGFSFYSTWFLANFAATNVKDKTFMNEWRYYGSKQNGVRVGLHPQSAGGQQGRKGIWVYQGGQETVKNEADFQSFHHQRATQVHVAVWRQKTRLRVYVNQEKILDIPKAFEENIKYNRILFTTGGYQGNDSYFVANLRLAVGAPDTRNKLITEGKFTTTGITFDVGSDKIKPDSYGVLREIGLVLQENPNVRVKIIGHTDSDGNAQNNLELSKKRALAVKNALTKQFGIEASRMETDGKGASEPVDSNNTPQGKANNRRVEFVKL
ncbi:OmpA family protein [Raineya orbicola]|uniref:OmpA family n=1 Tax=Raineya orbicola TaxID=2016530 RepID=A0A2N3I7Q0_9BACT|nr:OmpA family protein [Raineya orbicola]PKQ66325.1 OmpA family [Raineya orbicola]